MKPTTYKKVVIAVMASIAFASAAAAQTVAVDFNNGGATNQSPGSSASAGPYATTGWYNNVDVTNPPTSYYNPYNGSDTGTKLTLVDTTNTSTGIQFGFNSFGFSTYNGGSTYSPGYGATGSADGTLSANQQLYNGAVTGSSGGYTQQITLSNISYSSYSVYLLVNTTGANGLASVEAFNGGNTSATPPVIGTYWFSSDSTATAIPGAGFSYLQATGTSQGTATLNANYVLFSGLTGSTVTFDASAPGTSYNGGVDFGGFEIVDTASTPEPSTYALMLAGLGFLVVTLRRRRLV